MPRLYLVILAFVAFIAAAIILGLGLSQFALGQGGLPPLVALVAAVCTLMLGNGLLNLAEDYPA